MNHKNIAQQLERVHTLLTRLLSKTNDQLTPEEKEQIDETEDWLNKFRTKLWQSDK